MKDETGVCACSLKNGRDIMFLYERVLHENVFVDNFFKKWRKWLGNDSSRELRKKKKKHLFLGDS
jgi:hypothetical protein